jgi:preprotein translocase subunit SecA
MMDGIKEELVGLLFHVEVSVESNDEDGAPVIAAPGLDAPTPAEVTQLRYTAADEDGTAVERGGTPKNAPCPCGSGRKYKRCHGAA